MPAAGTNPNAWNNWYHCVGSTYGSWLRGDPRGFRTFRHREHVEGDYRSPPVPGVWEAVYSDSQANLRYPPVRLDTAQRQIICRSMVQKLQADTVQLIAIAITPNHFHLLARFPVLSRADVKRLSHQLLQDGRDPSPRYFLSRSRRHASFALSSAGMKPQSPVWAARPKCVPINDRQHQINATRYIAAHEAESAAVWVLSKGFSFEVS